MTPPVPPQPPMQQMMGAAPYIPQDPNESADAGSPNEQGQGPVVPIASDPESH